MFHMNHVSVVLCFIFGCVCSSSLVYSHLYRKVLRLPKLMMTSPVKNLPMDSLAKHSVITVIMLPVRLLFIYYCGAVEPKLYTRSDRLKRSKQILNGYLSELYSVAPSVPASVKGARWQLEIGSPLFFF